MSLFRATARTLGRPAVRAFSRHGPQNPILNGILKNNVGYITAIIGAAIGVEFIYGKATYAVWSGLNSGVSRLSQFIVVASVSCTGPLAFLLIFGFCWCSIFAVLSTSARRSRVVTIT